MNQVARLSLLIRSIELSKRLAHRVFSQPTYCRTKSQLRY